MREQEVELIKNIVSLNSMKEADADSRSILAQKRLVDNAFKLLQNESLGAASAEFLNDPVVTSFIQSRYSRDTLKLWHFILTNGLDAIEEKIKCIISEYQEELKRGFGIPPEVLYAPELIRTVYLSGNAALIDIFKKYLPIPSVDVFKGYDIPTVVAENKTKIELSIRTLQDNWPTLSLDEITDKVVKIQRVMRSQLRYREEIRRIASREAWKDVIKTSPEKLIGDANKPYRPRCENQALARRIMSIAQQIRLFSTVKHWTSGDHIEAIFNDALYGRRQLLQSYLPFRPASLCLCDIEDGDGNVICLGPSEIDPKAMQANTVEILFDLDKLSTKNPAVFFKQRDLGFPLEKRRAVSTTVEAGAGTKRLFFSHTNFVRCPRTGFSYLSVYDGQLGGVKAVAGLPNYSLISYNVQNIHQILILNFFRFIDSEHHEDFESIRSEIYADLEKLTDEELRVFLEHIGRQLSDTSEFNFYGAHRIDFSTVIALSSYPGGDRVIYTINLQELLDSLERNDLRMFNEAKTNIPNVFNSYRFLDYLLSKTTSTLGRYELQRLRSKCITPSWVPPVAEPEPLTGEFLAMYLASPTLVTITPTLASAAPASVPALPSLERISAVTNSEEGQAVRRAPLPSTMPQLEQPAKENDITEVDKAEKKPKNIISKHELEAVLKSYNSSSFMGFLSTLWFFSWFISPKRSQAIIELSLLVRHEEVSREQIINAISKDRDGKRRVLLFKKEGNIAKNGTSTDEVIDKLNLAFN
jgi:hypothetical protein